MSEFGDTSLDDEQYILDLEQRISELEHQHKNDQAANQLLNEVCESQRKRIMELETSINRIRDEQSCMKGGSQ